jgi:hypothetical protein
MQQATEERRRTVILVHGGGFKPAQADLTRLWQDALTAGLARDYAKRGGANLLDAVHVQPVYYGDLVNAHLQQLGKCLDPTLDLEDRRRDLRRLAAVPGKKKFRRTHYEALPGKTALREFVADLAAPLLSMLGLAGRALERTTPVLAAYLGGKPGFREACEDRLMAALRPALTRGDDVLLLAHSMGSVISYDVLWRLSQEPSAAGKEPSAAGKEPSAAGKEPSAAGKEPSAAGGEPVEAPCDGRVHTWITFGSPLANHYVKRHLRGARCAPEQRYPNKVVNWFNVAAEDDFHCHDKTVSDDFGAMLRRQQISQIRDYRIYNLAVRYGRSNPHNSLGYLVHPRMTLLLYEWLTHPSRDDQPGRTVSSL